jgi:putative flippase GtrA
MVGIVNTLTGMAIMFSLYNIFNLNYWVSSAVNYVLASILSFFLNKHFTFRAGPWSLYMIGTFIITIVGSYLVSYGMAKPAMYHIFSNCSQKVRDNAAMLVGMCLFTGLNYIGQRFIVFRRRKG